MGRNSGGRKSGRSSGRSEGGEVPTEFSPIMRFEEDLDPMSSKDTSRFSLSMKKMAAQHSGSLDSEKTEGG